MSERERRRQNDSSDPSCEQDPEESGNEGLTRQRREVDDLLRAGDDIINRVLSGDSAAFLAAGQQQGGQ